MAARANKGIINFAMAGYQVSSSSEGSGDRILMGEEMRQEW